MVLRQRPPIPLRWLGVSGTTISCLITMMALPLGFLGTSASAAIHTGTMAGMGGAQLIASPDGVLSAFAQGLLIASLPLLVFGLWKDGWQVRLLSSGSGAALYGSMYVIPSLSLFGIAGGGLVASHLWAWKKRKTAGTC